jgi:hypothetical protein
MTTETWITCTCGVVSIVTDDITKETHDMSECLPLLNPDKIPENAIEAECHDRKVYHIKEAKYVSASGVKERIRMIGQIIKPSENEEAK